jgi:hypothetical protein
MLNSIPNERKSSSNYKRKNNTFRTMLNLTKLQPQKIVKFSDFNLMIILCLSQDLLQNRQVVWGTR